MMQKSNQESILLPNNSFKPAFVEQTILLVIIRLIKRSDIDSADSFKSIIQAVLNNKFIKIEKLAELADCNKSTVGRWRTGDFYPRSKHMRKGVITAILTELEKIASKYEEPLISENEQSKNSS